MSVAAEYPVLARVESPRDVGKLTSADLVRLAEEVRQFLIESVSQTGGHLGPNLGVVELTIALHRVFDSPTDTIVWDTGHQAYVHKLLTGRKAFEELRKDGGLSGYPSRAESEHDVVENTHASTSLSWADGIALEKLRSGDPSSTVAVIGDGALTGGMAWEALNNIAGGPDVPLVVVVNDNGRSYAPTVGGLAAQLDALRTSSEYEETLARGKGVLLGMGEGGRKAYAALRALKRGLKGALAPQSVFSDLDIKSIGPVDGHNLVALEQALQQAKEYGGPTLVHVITEKGRGYVPAESDVADRFHAVGRIHPETGLPVAPARFGWTKVFAEEIVDAASTDDRIVGVTAAMMAPVGLQPLADAFPSRVIDVGIAEQHALTAAAGMAYSGAHPVVCVYATFMNRAFDQLLMDIGLHSAPVTIVLDRAGITGDDGASHNGVWDLSLAAMVPGLRVFAPRDAATLRRGIREATAWQSGPTLVRYPKGEPPGDVEAVRTVDGIDVVAETEAAPDGADNSVLLVATGAVVPAGIEAAQLVSANSGGRTQVTVVDPGWVLPVNPALVQLAAGFDAVVSVEDGIEVGGVGSEIAREVRLVSGPPVAAVGVPGGFPRHAARATLLEESGLSAAGIAARIEQEVTGLGPTS